VAAADVGGQKNPPGHAVALRAPAGQKKPAGQLEKADVFATQ